MCMHAKGHIIIICVLRVLLSMSEFTVETLKITKYAESTHKGVN